MIKYLIASVLLFATPVLQAEPITGIFYNQDATGEGVTVFANPKQAVAYMYTYGDLNCHRIFDCDLNGMRWFLMSDPWDADADQMEGFLYAGRGIDWPTGINDPDNPFGVKVGEAVIVGVYRLKRVGNGYVFGAAPYMPKIDELGVDPLDPDDPLFGKVFEFIDPLFLVK
jgi:hypothetical protein